MTPPSRRVRARAGARGAARRSAGAPARHHRRRQPARPQTPQPRRHARPGGSGGGARRLLSPGVVAIDGEALSPAALLTRLNQLGHDNGVGRLDLLDRLGIGAACACVGFVLGITTLTGDNVNIGSRLEATNKEYGTNIIISESTYALVRDKFLVRELDNIRVKGKNKPVVIYELVDCLESLDPPVSLVDDVKRK